MKKIMSFLCLFVSLAVLGQSKDEIAVLNHARELNNAVFVKKDSALLAKLFSAKLSYGHSGGKIENRQEALNGILGNQSTYTDVNLGPTSLMLEDKTAVTRYIFTATETTKEGKA